MASCAPFSQVSSEPCKQRALEVSPFGYQFFHGGSVVCLLHVFRCANYVFFLLGSAGKRNRNRVLHISSIMVSYKIIIKLALFSMYHVDRKLIPNRSEDSTRIYRITIIYLQILYFHMNIRSGMLAQSRPATYLNSFGALSMCLLTSA